MSAKPLIESVMSKVDLRKLTWVICLIAVVGIAHEIGPAFNDIKKIDVHSKSEFQKYQDNLNKFIESLKKYEKTSDPSELSNLEYFYNLLPLQERTGSITGNDFSGKGIFFVDLSFFVRAMLNAEVSVSRTDTGAYIESTKYETAGIIIKYDQLAASVAIIIVLSAIPLFLGREFNGVDVYVDSDQYEKYNIEKDNKVIKEFRDQAKSYEIRANEMFLRANFLLAGEILMAFVGIFVFFISTSDAEIFLKNNEISINRPEVSSSSYFNLSFMVRPFLMLVFIEAIAWFLLRQYRAQIEDFKIFHRFHRRRANVLASSLILYQHSSTDLLPTLVIHLLSDDQYNTLKTGESTEALEVMKIDENNPVFKLFEMIINREKNSVLLYTNLKTSGLE